MGLAELRKRSTKDFTHNLMGKANKIVEKKKTVKKSTSKIDTINNICDMVEQKLGHLANDFENIFTEEDLHRYIDTAIKNGYIAIDTETTGLDPITDQIVGACIYTPGEKAAYIPINHISKITLIRLNNQLTNEQVANEFRRLKEAKTKIIYFNAKFDIRVMRHQLGIDLPAYWDAFLAAKVLKENEEEGNLKYLWKKYCSPDKDAEHFTFEKFFKGISFNLIPIKIAYLYAAKDAIMTWELFKFQEPYLIKENPRCQECGFQKLSDVFLNIEMPIVGFISDIEDNGVLIDLDYTSKISEKYHKLLEEKLNKFNTALLDYKDKIIQYKTTHPDHKLSDPINLSSPQQLAILFYDILGLESVSRKQPRGTGEEILEKLNHPLCKPILEFRGVKKLLTTYIDKMPEILNKKTGRIHCTFKQYGADSGRFASADPNLQNIPSHNHDIRPMFISSKNHRQKIEDSIILYSRDKVMTLEGLVEVKNLTINHKIITNKGKRLTIKNISKEDNIYTVEIEKGDSNG